MPSISKDIFSTGEMIMYFCFFKNKKVKEKKKDFIENDVFGREKIDILFTILTIKDFWPLTKSL